MVTLALAELLFTLAPTWNSVFGGESGISTMRGPRGASTSASDTDVYYLTLAWFVVSAWCMWAFTEHRWDGLRWPCATTSIACASSASIRTSPAR